MVPGIAAKFIWMTKNTYTIDEVCILLVFRVVSGPLARLCANYNIELMRFDSRTLANKKACRSHVTIPYLVKRRF